MEKKCSPKPKVCVTGGSGYIGSCLVKKLLEKGYTVHATLRNLEDMAKVSLLESLPSADTNLFLFQADIYNPQEFEPAIRGCEFVFHVANSAQHDPKSTLYKDVIEAAIGCVKSIADSCIRSKVKRLIYTASVMATAALNENGNGFKSCIDESCWTPPDHSFTFCNEQTLEYTKAKTLAEKAVLKYNEDGDGKLEVVTLACGLVGGETITSSVPLSVHVLLSQLTGNPFGYYHGLCFIQELMGSVPLVHVHDVCEAHIFFMEKPSLKGRFVCAAANPTTREIAIYFEQNHPEFKIDEKFMGEVLEGKIIFDSSKLMKMGFEYSFDMEMILEESLKCGKRLGVFSPGGAATPATARSQRQGN